MTLITALQIENDADNLAYKINQQLDDTDTLAECLSELRASCSTHSVDINLVTIEVQDGNWKVRYSNGQLAAVAKLEPDGIGSNRSSWDWYHGIRGVSNTRL